MQLFQNVPDANIDSGKGFGGGAPPHRATTKHGFSREEHDAREMLRLVGGKENIAALTHCVTRMRFTLVDPSIADVPAIEALPSAKGSFTQAGQFQVIIGNCILQRKDENAE